MINRLMCWFILMMVSCVSYAVDVSRLDPEEIQTHLAACAHMETQDKTCLALRARAMQLNHLAYSLRTNPLLYGQKVLSLQEKVMAEQLQSDKHALSKKMERQYQQHCQELHECLVVIRWLESPER